MSPTPTLVLDKLLFFADFIFNFKAIDSSSSERVQHFEDNQFYFKTIKKAFNTGDWLESTGKWTLLWISKEVPAPGRYQLVKVKPKSGDIDCLEMQMLSGSCPQDEDPGGISRSSSKI